MALSDLTEEVVEAAINEFDRLGREAFLEKYSFGKARGYFLRYRKRYYDSKAIVGAAHGYLRGEKALGPYDFSGGDATVRKRLDALGFEVFGPDDPPGWETMPGEVLANHEVSLRFGVGNMGGMRRNRKHRHLVLISDPTKSLYDDRWEGSTLHYTGMGKNGPQKLTSQNRTLAESRSNGETLHLFEVLEPGRYTYAGKVALTDDPYQDWQPDEEGRNRRVWMFPLKLLKGGIRPKPTIEQLEKIEKERIKKVKKLSPEELKRRALAARGKPAKRPSLTEQFSRRPEVAEYVKTASNGRCDLCQCEAPFKTKSGEPYLECHHIKPLSIGGHDTVENAVALCPNCHRKMHSLDSKGDREKLKRWARRRLAGAG